MIVGGASSAFAVLLVADSTIAGCFGEGGIYPNLSIDGNNSSYPVKCPATYKVGGEYKTIYAKSAGDCASAGMLSTNPDVCDTEETDNETDNKVSKKDEISVDTVVLICALCVSVTLNIVFIALLISKKKKVVVVQKNQSVVKEEPTSSIYPTPNSN